VTSQPSAPITELLRASRDGDGAAFDRLMPIVYAELKRLAASQMRAERGSHTLQPTALVHDCYLRLVGMDLPWQDRQHFFAVAALTMRRLLVEHARARLRKKRGGGAARVDLDHVTIASSGQPIEVLALDSSLERLAAMDQRRAKLVELHYFAGLSYREIADLQQISEATVSRDLRFARAWLFREMRTDP
jgi:RNA polymerase sigma factor (TIGR02999 family)